MEDNKATNNTTENVKASKTKDKGIMSVPQALSCLEVAMKWQTGFKKEITVDTFTESELKGAMKTEIETLEVGVKNENGYTIEECYEAYHILKEKLKVRKKRASMIYSSQQEQPLEEERKAKQ